MKQERIQKILAQAGHGSRREIEIWLAEGRVTVNGKPAHLGDKAWPADHIQLDGKSLPMSSEPVGSRTIIYHKPEGEVVTRRDPEGRPTVFALLPRLRGSRWIAVGRLDVNTSGLLLLTTDGELASRLMHPSSAIEREYAVRILGEVSPVMLQQMRNGVELDDGPAHFDEIVDAGGSGANHWFHVVLREGRKREVRRLWESQGLRVSRLIRVRYGEVQLGRALRAGQWRDLRPDELASLYMAAGLEAPASAGIRREVAIGDRRKPHDDSRRPARPEMARGSRSSAQGERPRGGGRSAEPSSLDRRGKREDAPGARVEAPRSMRDRGSKAKPAAGDRPDPNRAYRGAAGPAEKPRDARRSEARPPKDASGPQERGAKSPSEGLRAKASSPWGKAVPGGGGSRDRSRPGAPRPPRTGSGAAQGAEGAPRTVRPRSPQNKRRDG